MKIPLDPPFSKGEVATLPYLPENGLEACPEMLESVFDRDEVLAWDAIDQLQQSVSP